MIKTEAYINGSGIEWMSDVSPRDFILTEGTFFNWKSFLLLSQRLLSKLEADLLGEILVYSHSIIYKWISC